MAALAFPTKPETFPPQWLYRETKCSVFCPQAQVPPANSISASHREGVPLSWQEVGAHGFLCHALHMAPKGCSHTDEQELAAVHDLGVWRKEPTLLWSPCDREGASRCGLDLLDPLRASVKVEFEAHSVFMHLNPFTRLAGSRKRFIVQLRGDEVSPCLAFALGDGVFCTAPVKHSLVRCQKLKLRYIYSNKLLIHLLELEAAFNPTYYLTCFPKLRFN